LEQSARERWTKMAWRGLLGDQSVDEWIRNVQLDPLLYVV
jgi:hypothetical protein